MRNVKRPPLIKQHDLREIVSLRDHLRELREAIKQFETDLAKREALATYAIDQGAPTEPGPLRAGITVTEGARRPAWKDEFARACGADAVEAVIARTVAPEKRTLTIVGALELS